MFQRRPHTVAVVGVLAGLLTASLALPLGAAANPPGLTWLPPHVTVQQPHAGGLPTTAGASFRPTRVTTLADAIADDGKCSLREAIIASQTAVPGPDTTGRCRPGDWGFSTIEFAVGGVITLTADLPAITGWLTIDATTAPSPVTIDGADTYRPFEVASQASLDLYDLTVTNGASARAGGAMLNRGWVTLSGVTISSSSATLAGGAINSTLGSLTWITSSTIIGNMTGGVGGGIRSVGMTLLFDCLVADNAAVGGGGALEVVGVDGSVAVAYNTTFSGNEATGPGAAGGAIENRGLLQVLNVTFAGNTAAVGGAIRDTREMSLYHATITGNTAAVGSGIASTGTPFLTNNLVLGNTGSDPEVDATPDATSSHNLTVLPAGVGLDQVLDAAGLADNGGTTPTVALVRDAANPAWNGGDDALWEGAPMTFDQRLFERSSPVDIGAYEIDDLAPAMVALAATLSRGSRLDGTALAGGVAWSATENGSGLAGYEAQVSINGAGYVPVPVAPMATSEPVRFANGSSYQYRARAVDADGNWSAWAAGPDVTARLVQQVSGMVTYSRGWTTDAKAGYSGGTAKYATRDGAWVRFTATGRAFSFITTKGPSRGRAEVYVDGKYVTTINLRAASTTYRIQAWTKTFSSSKSHTIKVVLLGTKSHPRVDADAFAVLK